MNNNQQLILNGFSRQEFEESLISKMLDRFLTVIQPKPQEDFTEEFLTRKQVAKLLSISLVTVSKYQKNGTFKVYYFGTRPRFKKSEILNFSKSQNNSRTKSKSK